MQTIFTCNLTSTNSTCECKTFQKDHGCTRPAIMFGLSILASLLAAYSCYRTYKKLNKISFQLLPLTINTISSASLVFFYVQAKTLNTSLYLFIIEVYTYFLILYGLITIVLKRQDNSLNKKRVLDLILIVFTIVSAVAQIGSFIAEIILSHHLIDCSVAQGQGTILMLFLQSLIIGCTVYYSGKFNKALKLHQSDENLRSSNIGLIAIRQAEAREISLTKKKIRLAILALFISFILHISDIILYYYVDDKNICKEDGKLQICNNTQLIIRTIQNIAEIFPHFVIPFIFWYLPDQPPSGINQTETS